MGKTDHRKDAPDFVTMAVISVSSTRTLAEDKSGHWICKRAEKEGHRIVAHEMVPDDMEAIRALVTGILETLQPDAVLITGGSGISEQDVTIEAIRPLFRKELSAFGALFALLSFEEIDAAAMLSRAAAGIVQTSAVFCMPGSLNACKTACEKLIFPEIGHLIRHLRKG